MGFSFRQLSCSSQIIHEDTCPLSCLLDVYSPSILLSLLLSGHVFICLSGLKRNAREPFSKTRALRVRKVPGLLMKTSELSIKAPLGCRTCRRQSVCTLAIGDCKAKRSDDNLAKHSPAPAKPQPCPDTDTHRRRGQKGPQMARFRRSRAEMGLKGPIRRSFQLGASGACKTLTVTVRCICFQIPQKVDREIPSSTSAVRT